MKTQKLLFFIISVISIILGMRLIDQFYPAFFGASLNYLLVLFLIFIIILLLYSLHLLQKKYQFLNENKLTWWILVIVTAVFINNFIIRVILNLIN